MSIQRQMNMSALLSAAVLALAAPAAAETLHVPGEYAKIQEAIDAALAGDIVEIADGLYTGAGNKDLDFLGKAITVRSASGDPTLCIIDCEHDGRGFHFRSGEGPDSIVRGLTIAQGLAATGAGICCEFSSPTIVRCVLAEGVAMNGGGIAWVGASARPTLVNCLIRDNSAFDNGGAVYSADSGAGAGLVNCVLMSNTAVENGGGVYCAGDSPSLTNCTMLGNAALNDGGGVHCAAAESNLTMTNCILWGDTPQEVVVEAGVATLSYCNVQGGWPGVGNIDANPKLAAGADDGPQPVAGSPCIDAGDNTALPLDFLDLDGDGDVNEPLPIDLEGEPRFYDDPDTIDTGNGAPPLVDIGAYEYPTTIVGCVGDLDGDDDTDASDLGILLAAFNETDQGDLDYDGDTDHADLGILLADFGCNP